MKNVTKIAIGAVSVTILLLIIGTIFSVYPLYQAAQDISVTDQNIEILKDVEGDIVEIEASITLKNPHLEIEVQELTYRVYIEDEYVGENSKKNLEIPTGESTIELPFSVNLTELNESIGTIQFEEELQSQLEELNELPEGIEDQEDLEEFLEEQENESLTISETVEVKVEADITVPVKWFNMVTLTSYTLTISHTEEVQVPMEIIKHVHEMQ